MTIGLLLCDHVRLPYLHVYGDYPAMFMDFLPDCDFIVYDITHGQYPQSVDECTVWMTSGSVYSVYDDVLWIHWLADFVRRISESQSKFVGVCFGHQMLGHALGGKVEKAKSGWCIGVHSFDIIKTKSWIAPQQDQINVLMMCQDQIVSLPPEAEVLASTDCCPNAIIQIGQNILGIQGHPEFPKEYDEDLMLARIERMGEDLVKKGVESLNHQVHTALLRDWIMNFIHT